jgi:drug/metabolite transporter (DMT)-like permease
VTILYALVCAFVYGLGDYAGGRASRTDHSASVTATAQAAGILVLIPGLLIVSGSLSTRGIVAGIIGGVSGEIGLLLLYTALARGAMTVVSPIAAMMMAVVPVIGGVVIGESLKAVHVAGIALALVAILLISRGGTTDGSGPAHHQRPSPAVLFMAVAAGTGFGLFVVALDRAGDDVGLWPLIAARPVGTVLASGYAIAVGVKPWVKRDTIPLAGAAGVFDVLANIFAILAAQRGKLAIAGVLIALYPASTVLLARLVDREPITRPQVAGFSLAVVSVAMIAL